MGTSIAKIRYTHDAMIDLIIASPAISQGELAREFGFTEAWVSIVINSDAFQARLAQRRSELVDPVVLAGIEKRFAACMDQALEVAQHAISVQRDPDYALELLKLGMGKNRSGETNITQNFVVALPGKETTSNDWLLKYAPGAAAATIDVTPTAGD